MAKPRTIAPGVGARIERLVPEGRTIAEFADALGVSHRTLGNYIRGERDPSFDFLVKLGRVTGADMNWLMMGEEGGNGGKQKASRRQSAPAHCLDPVVLSRVGKLVTAAHKKAGITLPPEALVREVGIIYNEILELVADPSDASELQALLPWAEARLKKRLAEAVAKPGTGKRSA